MRDKTDKYLSENGWENTGGVTPFWSHEEITGGKLVPKYHAKFYQDNHTQEK